VFRLDLLRADYAADASSSLYSVMEEDFASACFRTLDSVSINRSSTVDASRLIVVADAVRSSDSRRWYHAMLTNRLYHRRRSDVDGRGSKYGVVEMTPPDTPRHRLDDVDLDTISTDASWTN